MFTRQVGIILCALVCLISAGGGAGGSRNSERASWGFLGPFSVPYTPGLQVGAAIETNRLASFDTWPTALGPSKTRWWFAGAPVGMPQGDYEAFLEAARLIIAAREADKRRQPREAARLRERVKRLLPGFAQTAA